MARNEKPLQELQTQIDLLLQFNKDNLISRREWGTISLEEAKLDFDRIYDIVNYLKVLPLNLLTTDALNLIATQLRDINTLFDQINNFSIEAGNPAQQRIQFVSQVQAKADSFYSQASPWIPFLAYQKGDVSKNIESLTESVKKGQELVESTKQNISV